MQLSLGRKHCLSKEERFSHTQGHRRLSKTEITEKDIFPLPRISDCLDALSGAVFFSVLIRVIRFFNFR